MNILLVAMHLPSRMHMSIEGLNFKAIEFSQEIKRLEDSLSLKHTIVVGDFNLNPFDFGMIASNGFNAVMCPRIAKQKLRKCSDQEYKFFYNPMWHLMGNADRDVKGTYYYTGDNTSIFWNTFDQVIIRPNLIDYFDLNSLKILTTINGKNIISQKGIPKKRDISDHLPIVFSIEEER